MSQSGKQLPQLIHRRAVEGYCQMLWMKLIRRRA